MSKKEHVDREELVDFITSWGPEGVPAGQLVAEFGLTKEQLVDFIDSISVEDSVAIHTIAELLELGDEAVVFIPRPEPTNISRQFEPKDTKAYWPDYERGVYAFHELGLVLPIDMVDGIVAAYSRNLGAGESVNVLARKNSLTRAQVIKILRATGTTHDSIGMTKERLSKATEEEVVSDILAKKENAIIVKAEKARWDAIKANSDKWERLDKFILERFASVPPITIHTTTPAVPAGPAKGKQCLVLGLQDLHYGKYGWNSEVGERFDRETCAKRLNTAIRSLLERTQMLGGVSKVIVPVGGDWFHVDNREHKTTKGTPQDVDGTFSQIVFEGTELAANMVSELVQFADVELVYSGGNHDQTMSQVLLLFLARAFANDPRVSVQVNAAPRQYRQWGNALLGFSHGELKDAKLAQLMPVEAAEMWSKTTDRMIFTGHFHTERTNEFFGVEVHHCPSLAGTDRWHSENGYVGNRKAMTGYLIHKDFGRVAILTGKGK